MKNFLSILILSVVFWGGAAVAKESKMPPDVLEASYLTYKTSDGVSDSMEVIVKKTQMGRSIEVDGVELKGMQKVRSAANLKGVLKLAHTKYDSSTCADGIFEHKVYKKGKFQTEKGCLSSAAFVTLQRSFQNLKDY